MTPCAALVPFPASFPAPLPTFPPSSCFKIPLIFNIIGPFDVVLPNYASSIALLSLPDNATFFGPDQSSSRGGTFCILADFSGSDISFLLLFANLHTSRLFKRLIHLLDFRPFELFDGCRLPFLDRWRGSDGYNHRQTRATFPISWKSHGLRIYESCSATPAASLAASRIIDVSSRMELIVASSARDTPTAILNG